MIVQAGFGSVYDYLLGRPLGTNMESWIPPKETLSIAPPS